MVFPNSSTEYTIMVIIKQDEMQFVLLKGNAFLLKGRILIVLEYQVFGQYVLVGIWGGAAWARRQPKTNS